MRNLRAYIYNLGTLWKEYQGKHADKQEQPDVLFRLKS